MSAPPASQSWEVQLSSEGEPRPDEVDVAVEALAVNGSGQVLVAGTYAGAAVRLGATEVLPYSYDEQGFVIGLEADGSQRFVRSGGSLVGSATSIGDDFIVGIATHGPSQFGDLELAPDVTPRIDRNAALVRMRSDGAVAWTSMLGATAGASVRTVAASRHTIWVGGTLRGSATAHVSLSEGSERQLDAYLLRLDPRTGEPRAGLRLESPRQVSIEQIQLAFDGGAFVLGRFHGALSVAGHSLEGDATARGFLARLGEDGTPRWLLPLGDAHPFVPGALEVLDGGCLVIGVASGDLRWAERTLSVSRPTVVTLRVDAAGSVVSARAHDGAPEARVRSTFAEGGRVGLVVLQSDGSSTLDWLTPSGDPLERETVLAAGAFAGPSASSPAGYVIAANTEHAGLLAVVRRVALERRPRTRHTPAPSSTSSAPSRIDSASATRSEASALRRRLASFRVCESEPSGPARSRCVCRVMCADESPAGPDVRYPVHGGLAFETSAGPDGRLAECRAIGTDWEVRVRCDAPPSEAPRRVR